MKKNKSSKSWLLKRHKHPFFKQSKLQGYRARSAYKLIEINKKFNFITKNSYIIDLGAAPGGWSQVVANKMLKGKILSIDIKPMKELKNVKFLRGNFLDRDVYSKILTFFDRKIDILLSDMAANTTGNKDLDSYKTGELCLKAMDLAQQILRKDGVFLSKVFMGSIFTEINRKAKKRFRKVVNYKPSSSKKESKEIYIYCKGI